MQADPSSFFVLSESAAYQDVLGSLIVSSSVFQELLRHLSHYLWKTYLIIISVTQNQQLSASSTD